MPMTIRPIRLRAALFACALLGVGAMTTSNASAQTAEVVFMNGKVFTADGGSALAQGFAIRDGRFVAVGSSDAMRQHVGAGTRVVDLGGRFVTPGLADGHLHNE